MFFSAELLAKKNPLGVVWLVSHGKKVSKQKIMQVKVKDMCEELLNPEVPHALRLQGILCAGVTLVFSRQQNYLLHDAQDMMRRVTRAMLPSKGEETLLPAGKNAAALEAITLDLGSGPLYDALALRPGPAWSEGREQEELFYTDMDIEAAQHEAENATLALWQTPDTDRTPHNMLSVTLNIENEDKFAMAEMSQGGAAFLLAEPEVFQVDSTVEEERILEQDEEFNVAMQPEVEENEEQQHVLNIQEETAEDNKQDAAPKRELAPSGPSGQPGISQQRKRKRRVRLTVDEDLLINTHIYRDWQQDASDIVQDLRSLKKRRVVMLQAVDKASSLPWHELALAPATVQFRDHQQLKGLFSLPAQPISNTMTQQQEMEQQQYAVNGELQVGLSTHPEAETLSPAPLHIPEDEEEDHKRACEQELQDIVGHMLSEQGIPGASAQLPQWGMMAGNDLEVEQLRARGDTPATNSTGPSQLAPSSGILTPGSVPRFDRPGSSGNEFTTGHMSSPQQPDGLAASPTLARFKCRTSTPHTRSANGAAMQPFDAEEDGPFTNGDVIGMDLGGPEMLAADHEADEALRRQLVKLASDDFTEETWGLICDLKTAFDKEDADGGPMLSLFDAITSSGLDRFQAARLFHQVMILITHGIVEALQSEAGGDLMLRPGHRLL